MIYKECVDFWRSRICWNHGSQKGSGSFLVEAVLRICDSNDREEELIALGAGVLAGNMYVEDNLVKDPAYFFQIAASDERNIIFRTYLRHQSCNWKSLFRGKSKYDTIQANQEFETLHIELKKYALKKIDDFEDMQYHYLRHGNFSCQVKIPLTEKRNMVLEFPVKHSNILPEREIFQIETGPLLFADPKVQTGDLFSKIVPGFIHFNSFGRADFSLDFPYGVRYSSKPGALIITSLNCDIELFVRSDGQ